MPNIWTFTSRHFSVKQVELLREMAELRVETQAVQDNQTIFPCQKLGCQGYDMRGRATQTARNLRSCPSTSAVTGSQHLRLEKLEKMSYSSHARKS